MGLTTPGRRRRPTEGRTDGWTGVPRQNRQIFSYRSLRRQKRGCFVSPTHDRAMRRRRASASAVAQSQRTTSVESVYHSATTIDEIFVNTCTLTAANQKQIKAFQYTSGAVKWHEDYNRINIYLYFTKSMVVIE